MNHVAIDLGGKESQICIRQPDGKIDWAGRLAERRGRPVAAVALGRKLAGILFAIWRDGTASEAKRSAEAVTHG